ncbi:MAG: hypothetical protein A3F13_08590 [Gammaproteobacteria bacterium RIFCSPHIGHO2_12_FULL_40_19]|nr:MAG: hypothetical protein A3F13_08590 [Gammaproteobacteria bacterium RIFCSPHIGHO2_12_FULL_40_19]
MKRYIEPFILDDLKKKMVFIGGPRQVGKTMLSKSICRHYKASQYLNLDLDSDRKVILKHLWSSDEQLVVFDELHKYPRWKRWIKGVYDTKPAHQQYLVTGSARLDIYRRGGDSLMGRYHYWRLHPFTLDEHPSKISQSEAYERLMTLGGFPEPFINADIREAKRWRTERFLRVIREDVRDLENIREIQLLQLFADALRERVGGMISFSNLASDLEIAPKTAKSWLNVLERMYLLFPIYPYCKNIPRAIKKPAKVYFYDNADCADDPAVRLENLVATHLLKRLHFMEDYFGHRCGLHYIRDRDDREVDFVTTIDNKVIDLIEVKSSDTKISSSLKYYKELLKPKQTVQIVGNLSRPFEQNGIRVTNPIDFFKVGSNYIFAPNL